MVESARASPPVILLGPQRLQPTVGEAAAGLGLDGPVAVVTAGWEEREAEDEELLERLGLPAVNLELYRRTEATFRADPDLLAGLRRRQDRLRKLQDLYRLRLGHALEAARELLRRADDPVDLEPERASAVAAVRALDAHHLDRVREVQEAFEAELEPAARPALAEHRAELAALLGAARALCVAGGHVAVLLNRMRLLGVADLFLADGGAGRPVVAWSAGAMALAERVVLFHDSPPQGAGDAEVLRPGLGLVRGVVPLPHAGRRLRLHDPIRVSLFARRFAPDACVALDEGARLEWVNGAWRPGPGTRRLTADGTVAEMA